MHSESPVFSAAENKDGQAHVTMASQISEARTSSCAWVGGRSVPGQGFQGGPPGLGSEDRGCTQHCASDTAGARFLFDK